MTTGNTPGGENLLFNSQCPFATITGATVSGCTNTSSTYLNISSDGIQSLTASDAGGQAKVNTTANNGTFSLLNFGLQDNTLAFGQLVFSISWAGRTAPTLTFTTTFFNGGSNTSSAIQASSNGYFTITAGLGEQITAVGFTSDIGVSEVKHIRIDGIATGDQGSLPPVPEPSTYVLFGTALSGLGLIRYRQTRKKS